MAKASKSKSDKLPEHVQQFTTAMSVLYAIYWIVLGATNNDGTGGIRIVGDIILVALVGGGLVMGLLYAMRAKK